MNDTNNSSIAAKIERMMHTSSNGGVMESSALARKVQEDINFLLDRIDRVKKLQTPNSSVLKTYQSMLESRQAVLQWLQENGDTIDDKDDSKTTSIAS